MRKADLRDVVIGGLTILQPGNGKIIGKKNPKKRGTWICKC